MEQKIIKIFLASSNELSDDRERFGNFVRRINQKIFNKQGLNIVLFEWEDEDAAYRGRRKQDEYNERVRESDLFMVLFYTKGGNFTIEEFEVALAEYGKKKSPIIYVYFKDLPEEKKWSSKLKAFTKRLGNLGLFWTSYSNQDSLRLNFLYQLLIGENELIKLKVEDGTVKLGDIDVAKMSNLSFAADNKDYQRISAELNTLPNEIDNAQKYLDEHPDNEYLQGELQKKLNRYNNLKEEFARLQQALFDTSQRIATMQRENLSDKLRRATEAFESGNLAGANTLLDEIALEAETHHANLEQDRALVHQDIEAFLLQAKTKMAEVSTPIEERIKEVHAIYAKADQWAKDSALPDDKLDGLLDDYSKFLYDYGKYKEAEPIYLRLISLREGTKGKENSDTATSYNDIGTTYKEQGDYTKALEYYFKALDIQEKVLGKEHPDTATSYNNIGSVYDDQGDYPKALEYYSKALDIHEKVLGKEHPSTATSYNNIGGVYKSQGDYPKALEYYSKALDIQEKVLGKEHPSTATSYNNIGGVYHSQGDYTKALEYYFKALDIFKKVLGEEHPNTAASYNNIGSVYDDQGDYPKALEYYSKALDIHEKVLGKEHPSTATSYNNIAGVYDSQGDYPKALEYYFKALDIREKVLGKEHPDTATSYNNIGSVYYSLGDNPKALEYYFKALDIREKVLGKEHPDTATTYNNIGTTYYNQGDYTKALEYYFKALDIVKNVLGEGHPDTATSYNNIGGVYDSQGNYPKALEYYFKDLAICEKVLGKEHPSTATSYNNIGMTYINLKDYTKALGYLQKALVIDEKVLGPDHPNIKTVKKNMEFCQLMEALQDVISKEDLEALLKEIMP